MDKKTKIWIIVMEFFKPYCHQLTERSFFIKNYQMPVCARCVGLYISYILGIIVFFKKRISIVISFIMSFIMFLDWFLQFIKIKSSTNLRRLITGFIGGFGFIILNLKILKAILNKSKVN